MSQPRSVAICRTTITLTISVFLLAALVTLPVRAQSTYGSIVGIITDSSGAVVPGASVTVTNIGTRVAVKVQTDAGGKYSMQDLLPADYKVTVEKSDFKRIERDQVPVQVGTVIRIDLSLTVGNVNETVEVNTSAPLLQTDTSNMNQEVEGDVVQQMPLNGRNVMNLVELAPGVVPAGSASGSTGLDQSSGRTGGGIAWNNYEVGGAIQGWSADYIDGVPNQVLGDNSMALVPTQDAVQEFSVVTSVPTADFGRTAGGVVNMSTKSGANGFHGSAYEYFRNADFNANSWFNNHSAVARSEWNQNQYGVVASGPIKRDKAFFMFTWENFKALTDILNTDTVATAAMQNGVIPEVYGSNGALSNNVVDPLKNCNITHTAGNSGTPGYWTITNLYTGGCGDPLDEVLKQYYPLPNVNGTGYNWIMSSPLANTQKQYNGRVDYQITPKQRFFARYTWWMVQDSYDSIYGDVGSPATVANPTSGAVIGTTPTTWPTAAAAVGYRVQQGVLGDTYTLNPTTVADIRASYSRQFVPDTVQNMAVNEAQFDQYNPDKYYTTLTSQMQPGLRILPEQTVSGVHSLYTFGGISNYQANWYNTYSFNANLVKIMGSHSLKVGAEARLMDDSGGPAEGETAGYYTYSTAFSGDEWASFLMGYPAGSKAAQFQVIQPVAGYSYYQGYYVMDDWQASHKLTLNLGLRYELPGSVAERNNRLSVLLPNAVDPYTGITGTEAVVGSPLYHPRTSVVEKYDLFAPRVGFAYRASDTTVLKGGYGLSFIPNDLSGPNGGGALPFSSVFNNAYTTAVISTGGLPTPLSYSINPSTSTILGQFVTGGLLRPSPTPPANFMTTYGSLTSYKAQTISGPYPYQNFPYVQEWNVGLSHQFKGDWMAEVSYAGMKGTNLPQIGYPPHSLFSLDELGSQYYSMGYTALKATSSSTDGIGGCPNAPGLLGQISVGQCLRPNPYYADVEDSVRWAARQNYKAVLVNTEKRLGRSGLLKANYVWSQNMANTDTANQQLETTAAPRTGDGVAGLQDYNNLGNEYSLISWNLTNRFVFDYELNLPFGRGQKYANSLSDPLNAIASGWAVNGITIFQSGFPLFFQESATNFLTSSMGAGILRPSVVPGCNKKVAGGSQTRVLAGQWFNTACFVYPSTAGTDPTGQVTFGNEPRVDPDLHADGIKNFDFSFQKSTPIWERSSFVFRAEFFNIMNRVQFDPPNNTAGSANFGTVVHQNNNPRQIQLVARINF